MSNKYELSLRDWKTIWEYWIYIVASIILTNTTWLNELLCDYLTVDTVSLLVSIIGITARKFIKDYSSNK